LVDLHYRCQKLCHKVTFSNNFKWIW